LGLAAALATCRLDQLISPSTATIQLKVAADTVGIADTVRLAAIVTVDGKQNRALRVAWSANPPGLATVDTLGLVRGVARGTATITARIENTLFLPAPVSATAAVFVAVPRLELSASDTVLTSVGDTVCLTPIAKDARDTVLPGLTPDSLRPDSVFTPAGTIGGASCFVASRASGPVAFRAWLDIAQATKFVQVKPVAATLTVTPDSTHFNSLTEADTLTVAAVDRRGNPITSPSIAWTSDNGTVASVSAAGVITATGNGATLVRATSDTIHDSVRVVVRQVARRVVVTPAVDTLTSVRARQRLQATARDSLGQPIADAAFSWASLAPNTVRLVADSGAYADFEAAAEGVATIDVRGAAGGSVADTLARLEVRFALAAVTIAPTRPTLSHAGDTLRFSATGRDANDSTIANLRVIWSSSAPARISIDSVSGLATARDAGSAVIRARHESGTQDTTTATVAPPVLQTDVTVFAASAVRGSTNPVPTTRSVRDSGSVPLGAKARRLRSSNWLSVTPDTVDLLAGESKSLILSANPTGLADGVYRDTVVIEASGATGSPDSIPVAFSIYCPVAPITPDTVLAGSLTSGDCLPQHRPSGTADFYGFTATAGDTVAVTMSAGGSVDPFLFLLAPSGAVDTLNDDCSPATRNSCITRVLPATGSYTLEATTFSPATGAYTLTLSRLATPAASTALAQLKPNGATILSGGTTEFTSAVFRATGQDANPNDTLRLQIEVRPVAVPFSAPTNTGVPTPNASGVTLSASAGLTNDTTYHWRARTCDQTNRCGPWTAFASPAFTVAATGPVLTVTPDAIRDSTLAGSSTSIMRSLRIDNTGGGTFTWTATNKKPWLTVPASGSENTTVSLALNPTGLAAGVYEDTVVVTATGGALSSPDTTIVTFVIQQPVLVVSPAAINHMANAGSGLTFGDTLGINNTGTGALAWTGSADSAWVVLGNPSGSAPDKLPLTITPGSRPAGTYTAHVVISAPGAVGSPDTTPVTLMVFQPVLAVSPASVTDSANYGTTAPRDVALQITNTGGGTLTWSAAESPDAAWLSILPPPSGSAPGTVTLRLDPNPGGSLLASGAYATDVAFTSPEATNDPINVPVQFLIRRPVLNVTPASVFDAVTVGATTPRTIPVTIANGNGGVLSWSAVESPDTTWLSLSPTSAGAPGTLIVTLNPTNLSGGIHRDTLIIRSDSATGSPTRLPVRFDVLRPPDPPTPLQQFPIGSSTEIAVGGVTANDSVVFKAGVTDADADDTLRLELQVEKVGTGFSATSAVSAPVASGQTASVTFGAPFEDNSGYHWRVRTCDQTNRCSGWVSFGGNAEAAVDFFANPIPQDPAAPTLLKQFKANGTDSIPVRGTAGSSPATVVLEALVTDPDPGDVLTLEVEVKSTDLSFNASGATSGVTGVTTGNKARATKTNLNGVLLVGTNYYWRARVCDQTGKCSSTWVSYGGNSDVSGGTLFPADTDFHVDP
jgi:uncharacterized protein YjdB